MINSLKNIEIDIHFLDHYTDPAFAISQNGTLFEWNEAAERAFGYTREDVVTNTSTEFVELLHDTLAPIMSKEAMFKLKDIKSIPQLKLINATGQPVTCSLLLTPAKKNNEPAVIGFLHVYQEKSDIGYKVQHLESITNGLEKSFMLTYLDYDGFIIGCNNQFLKTSHWTPKRVIGKTFWQLFPDHEEIEETVEQIWQQLQAGNSWQGEVEKVTKDGQLYYTYLIAIPTIAKDSNDPIFVLIERDITDHRQLQTQLERIAYIDQETGLMNTHRLENIIAEKIEIGRHFSFVYLSIDKFYTLKDLYAVEAEESLIVEFTKRLKMYFQDSTMARINESDFVVLTPLSDWFIQGFLTYLQQNPIYNNHAAVPISISGGMTRFPEDQTTFSQMMKASVATIATVREAGGNNIVSLSKASHKALNRRSIVEKRLLLALDQRNLDVYYQPLVDAVSNKVIAMEALVRWHDEEIGTVSPDELIPIAEETGLISEIGNFMLEKACLQAVEWQKQGYDLKVSINSSVREFRDKNAAKTMLEIIERTGCPTTSIHLEITEKFALEAESESSIMSQMRTLEQAGISFILDDFGTGYASFRYMQLLPIKTLKIDQTFIASMLKSEKSAQIVNGMVQLGKSMNFAVIAEGVENEEQVEMLQQFGCDILQGYYISKPALPNELKSLLKA
ncbi:MAG: EAL domain-containing protein [Caryophanon sp.]|nr:EAL domain-containing protein [Caryophanon sp.]